MPRNAQGLYQLPPGNPVVPGTVIESAWANPTMSDIAEALTLSLPRDGSAPMTGALTLVAGNPTQPRHAASKAYVESFLAYATGLPIGFITPFAGLSGPAGWLKCDGSAINRVTYLDLFAVIGTLYGAGDGSTTFNLPDLRNEFLRGVMAPRTVGSKQAGSFTVHTHSLSDPGHAHTVNINSATENALHSHNIDIAVTGVGDHVHATAGVIVAAVAYGGGGSIDTSSGPDVKPFTPATSGAGNHTHSASGTISTETVAHAHNVYGTTIGAYTGMQIGSTGSNETVPQNTAFDFYIKAVNDTTSIGALTGIDSSDLQMIGIDYTNPAVPVIVPHANVAFGIPKIDATGKIPLFLLPTGTVVLLGLFDASSNQNPSQKYPAQVYHNGEQYIVSVPGTILVFDPATNLSAATPVVLGTVLTYISGSSINPTGWYYTPPAASPTQAASIVFLPTGGISATNVQAAIVEIDVEKVAKAGDTMTGNLNFAGAGRRITGDMSTNTLPDRLMFQTSVPNADTSLSVVPSGTGVISSLIAWSGSDVNNAVYGQLYVAPNEVALSSNRTGVAPFTPLSFQTGGNERMQIGATGQIGIGGAPNPVGQVQIHQGGTISGLDILAATSGANVGASVFRLLDAAQTVEHGKFIGNTYGLFIHGSSYLLFHTGNVERMRITPAGEVLIGLDGPLFAAGYPGTTHIAGGDGSINPPLGLRQASTAAGKCWKVGPDASNQFRIFSQNDIGVFLSDGGTAWVGYSDERLKDIFCPITDAVAKVRGLRAVIGKFKSDDEGKRHPFLIAQDVQRVLPEAVVEGPDGMLGLAYTEVIPLLVAAINELAEQIRLKFPL